MEEQKIKQDEKVKTEMKEKTKEVERKKETKVEIKPKEFAVAKGSSLRISVKKSMSICDMIKGKSPDVAMKMLDEVLKGKRVVPMRGREVPHQKSHGEKGIAGGRFPKNASIEFINLLKQANANATVNGVENPIIVIAKADIASRPYKKEGRRAKRAHIYIEVRDRNKLGKNKK